MNISKLTVGLVAVVLIGVTGCSRLTGALGGGPKTEDEKTLYALGLIVARNVSGFNLSPRDLDMVKAGLTDGLSKSGKPAVDIETYGPKVDALARARSAARATAEKEGAKVHLEKVPGQSRRPPIGSTFTTKAA
jgi:FKBP-type peptidyl-prolyl cis-trans isomerase FkpA